MENNKNENNATLTPQVAPKKSNKFVIFLFLFIALGVSIMGYNYAYSNGVKNTVCLVIAQQTGVYPFFTEIDNNQTEELYSKLSQGVSRSNIENIVNVLKVECPDNMEKILTKASRFNNKLIEDVGN